MAKQTVCTGSAQALPTFAIIPQEALQGAMYDLVFTASVPITAAFLLITESLENKHKT